MNNLVTTRHQDRNPLAEFHREMNRLFDDFWSGPLSSMSQFEKGWQPACDVEENEDHYLLTLEMPGISKDQIKIECVDHLISISGERKREFNKKEDTYWYAERRFGKFQRSFTLPAGVNAEKIEANYQDGVLRLYVPKAESAKPRQIKVSTGFSSGLFGKKLGQTTKEKEGSHLSEAKSDRVAS